MAWWNRARGERRVPRDVADAGLDSGHQIHIQATPGYDRLGVAMVREVQVSDAGESDLWRRYTQGEEPANDAEAQRFEAFRRHDQEWSGYWEEREAFRRYAAGDAPRDAAERQRFARFDRELADDIDARHPGQHERSKVSRLDVVTGTPAHEKTQGRTPCQHRGSTRPANPGNQDCQGPGVPDQVCGQTLSGSVRPIPRQTSRQGHDGRELLLCGRQASPGARTEISGLLRAQR